jgi:hypothetical protein
MHKIILEKFGIRISVKSTAKIYNRIRNKPKNTAKIYNRIRNKN